MLATKWRSWGARLGLVSFITMGGAIAVFGDCVLAQITPDSTLGAESSVVTPTNIDGLPTEQIDGGATRGANLFHSFEKFSVPTGSAAYFNNALDIQNVISRVTGSSISNIDGLIRANASANLFLLNPNGIIFGPSAMLSIGGSFLGSTASSLNFADGTQFSATAPQATPLLTISVPLGLQFGGDSARILVQGNGQGLRTRILGSGTTPELTTELIDTNVGLRVQPDQTLALVGGEVVLEGGTLKTAGGRIELGSVAGSELVSLTPIDTGWALGYEDVQNFRDIHLSQQAAVDSSGSGGGDIQVRGRRVTLRDGSQIEASTLGSEPGGTLTVTASESVELIGRAADDPFNTGLYALVYSGATGVRGNLTLETGQLLVRDGARVGTVTFGTGAGGTLSVTATDAVEVIGTSPSGLYGSGLFTETYNAGDAGNLTIATGRLLVRNGAQVSTSAYSTGDGGTLSVNAADAVDLIGTSVNGQFGSGLFSQTQDDGDAGDLTIATGRLLVRDGAQVSASTLGTGDGGMLSVTAADAVDLIGTVEVVGTSADDGQYPSGLYTQVARGAEGDAGDLTIATGRLLVRDGAQVSAGTFGTGDGGTLSITASDVVEVVGTSADGQLSSGLYTQVEQGAEGDAGDLTIATGRLLVRNGAQVSAGTFGTGDGGTLSVTASDAVELIGAAEDQVSSGLFALTTGDGDAGDLTIATGRLLLRDGAQVAVSSERSGDAGNLQVQARSIRLDKQAALSADTTAGQGNIILRSEDLVLRHGSNITTDATGTATGGNITIDTGVIATLENSDISANALEGLGGRVIINAQGIFGTEFRDAPTPESDITASSNLGPQFSGTVEINTSNVDLNQGLVTLPVELVNVEGLIANSCIARSSEQGGSFNITGAGGLPTRPGDASISPYSTGTVRSIPNNDASLNSSQTSLVPSTSKARPWKMGDPIVEPQGVYRLANGELVMSRECSH